MKNVPRPARTAPPARERVEPEPATAPHISMRDWVLAVLDEKARRHAAEAAQLLQVKQLARPPEPEQGNLCACLVTFARWRRCCVCGSLTLYVNGNAQSDGDVECGLCRGIREDLAKHPTRHVCKFAELPSLPVRVALHLRALFATGNDNAETQP